MAARQIAIITRDNPSVIFLRGPSRCVLSNLYYISFTFVIQKLKD